MTRLLSTFESFFYRLRLRPFGDTKSSKRTRIRRWLSVGHEELKRPRCFATQTSQASSLLPLFLLPPSIMIHPTACCRRCFSIGIAYYCSLVTNWKCRHVDVSLMLSGGSIACVVSSFSGGFVCFYYSERGVFGSSLFLRDLVTNNYYSFFMNWSNHHSWSSVFHHSRVMNNRFCSRRHDRRCAHAAWITQGLINLQIFNTDKLGPGGGKNGSAS
jgi:hypothetical protein